MANFKPSSKKEIEKQASSTLTAFPRKDLSRSMWQVSNEANQASIQRGGVLDQQLLPEFSIKIKLSSRKQSLATSEVHDVSIVREFDVLDQISTKDERVHSGGGMFDSIRDKTIDNQQTQTIGSAAGTKPAEKQSRIN